MFILYDCFVSYLNVFKVTYNFKIFIFPIKHHKAGGNYQREQKQIHMGFSCVELVISASFVMFLEAPGTVEEIYQSFLLIQDATLSQTRREDRAMPL